MKLSYKTVAIVLAGLGPVAATLEPAFASTTILTAEADSFVFADSPSTNRMTRGESSVRARAAGASEHMLKSDAVESVSQTSIGG